ncbi:metal ABC transporter permease [Gordonia sp. GW1C4-4]|uniref:Metal ABC transporter permease n=2 Tax=Gordonia tangerina TaxID=2911060 RepID=A0ABS9DK16_9ACTN|nr:metal ABC transporter permease [Gordonia tangerina]MCF3938178.1 metal ABC transporter permease [Gordonia tangerina]
MIEFLIEPWTLSFMRDAFFASAVAAAVCALISCWIVLIGWSLMGDAVSHAVLPGVVLSYIVGVPFAIGAVIFGFLAVALIGTIRDTSRVKEDAAIGIVFTTLFALGLVLVSATPSQTDLGHILFGNVLGVSGSALWQLVILGAVVTAVLVAKRRDLTLFAFDPVHAHAIGLSRRWLGALLLGLLALTCVVALQIVGVILVVAMLIIPGAAAHLLTDKFGHMLLLAPALAVGATVMGVYVSYGADVSPGGMVVVTQGVMFTAIYLFAPRNGLVTSWYGRRRTAIATV